MLLSISTTHRPATDLGFLLHKNPANVRTVDVPFGAAHVVYPEASDERCTAAVLVEVDPVRLTRNENQRRSTSPFALQGYVNDRPYAASSFMSVALVTLFGTAMGGRCKDRPELVDVALPLEVHVPVLPCRGGEALLRKVLEGAWTRSTPPRSCASRPGATSAASTGRSTSWATCTVATTSWSTC